MGLKAFFVVMAVFEMYVVAIHPAMTPAWLYYLVIVAFNMGLYLGLPMVAGFLQRFGVKD